jgi:hypothetical protein
MKPNMSNISAKRWSRRDFTSNAGIAALFAPFLAVLDGKSVAAATPGSAKYFLLFFTNGTDMGSWSPQGSDAGITSFSAMTQPLSAIKDSVILVDGLSGGGLCSSHGSPGGLCGAGWGANALISLEQFISDGLKANGTLTQIPHLVLGDGTTEQKTTFWRDNVALTPVSAPATAFSAVFGGRSPTTPAPTNGEPPPVDPRLARRQSVLDLLNSELTQLKNSLGTEERAKLDVHTESLRQIEQRLTAQMGGDGGGDGGVVPAADCTIPGAPSNTSKILMDSALMVQLSLNAFACDLTRVSAVQFGHHQRAPVDVPSVTGEWHNEFLHDPNKRGELVKLEQWLCEEFVKTVQTLKSLPAPDGGGTLYDQTLIMWARDMGDAVNHGDSSMAYVFSGGAGGYLKHSPNGRYVKASGGHIKALISCAEAMGVTDYAKFGTGDKTPLTQLGA